MDNGSIDQQTAGSAEIINHALDGEGRKAILAFERFMAVEQNVTPAFCRALLQPASPICPAHSSGRGRALMQAIKELRPPVFFKQQETLAAQVRGWSAQAVTVVLRELNVVLKETRLKAALAEDLTANFILRIARARRATR